MSIKNKVIYREYGYIMVMEGLHIFSSFRLSKSKCVKDFAKETWMSAEEIKQWAPEAKRIIRTYQLPDNGK